MAERGIAKRVVRTGFVKDGEIPSLMEASDVIVLPYLESTQSGVLLREVVPYRRPAIVADVGGLGEAAREHGLATLFPAGDAARLAEGIDHLLDDLSEQRAMGARQAAYSEENSVERVAMRHLRAYGLEEDGHG